MIGDGSFNSITGFSISSLPSLEIIDIGNDCFNAVSGHVTFNDFPELLSLKIGNNSFYNEDSNKLINCAFYIYYYLSKSENIVLVTITEISK